MLRLPASIRNGESLSTATDNEPNQTAPDPGGVTAPPLFPTPRSAFEGSCAKIKHLRIPLRASLTITHRFLPMSESNRRFRTKSNPITKFYATFTECFNFYWLTFVVTPSGATTQQGSIRFFDGETRLTSKVNHQDKTWYTHQKNR